MSRLVVALRGALVVGVLAGALGCGDPGGGAAVTNQPVASAAPTQQRQVRPACPVGELCERDAIVDGWRLPERCAFEHRGRWATRCRLRRVPFAMIRRFVVTRYRVVREDATSIEARPRDGLEGVGGPRIAALQVRGDVIVTTAGRPKPVDIAAGVTAVR